MKKADGKIDLSSLRFARNIAPAFLSSGRSSSLMDILFPFNLDVCDMIFILSLNLISSIFKGRFGPLLPILNE
jgi:hypothetical protein